MQHYQGGDDSNDANKEQFLQALQGSIQIFTNRMKSNYSRGRSIANDSSVQTLFMTINQMHPQLLQFVGEQEDIRGEEDLQFRAQNKGLATFLGHINFFYL